MHRVASAFWLALPLTACGGTQTPPPGYCADNTDQLCLGGEECADDEVRKCIVCRCAGNHPSSAHTPLYEPAAPPTNE